MVDLRFQFCHEMKLMKKCFEWADFCTIQTVPTNGRPEFGVRRTQTVGAPGKEYPCPETSVRRLGHGFLYPHRLI